MVGNEDKPHEYGIFMQSDQNPIGIKTLLKGKPQGDIHISAAEDMELMAWKNHYREAHEEDINDYANRAYYLTTLTKDINRTSQAGKIIDSAYLDFDIKSCTEDVDIWAPKQINIKADSSGESTWTDAGLVTIEAVGHSTQVTTGDISMKATRYIQTTSNDWSTTTDANFDVKAAAGDAAAQIRLETAYTGSNVNLKASGDMMLQSGVMNIKSTTHKETASNIYMNTSSQAAATAANASVTTPNSPDVAEGASGAMRAFIPETMVLLSIDIPNPRSTQGTSLTDLALNINTNAGYGGENIRNLHDTIVDMQLGVSAYVTKTYPATKGEKVYDKDQDAYVWTGDKNSVMEEPWNGYKIDVQGPKKQEPLGVVGPIRYNPSTRIIAPNDPNPVTDPPIACE